jgi:excisionase family DNA binding protein
VTGNFVAGPITDGHVVFARRHAMKRYGHGPAPTLDHADVAVDAAPIAGELPNRLLTAVEVAAYVGCHVETVRRAYQRRLLASQRFGVRGQRFFPADVKDWLRRGAPTQVS